MDIKKTPSEPIILDVASKTCKTKSFFEALEALKEEFKKVSWPTQEELRFSTKVVIGSIFVFGFGIYFFDLAIKGFLDSIALFMRLIFG